MPLASKMCYIVSKVREVIGKNTKFKFAKWRNFLSQNYIRECFFLLSFVVVTAVLFPLIGAIGTVKDHSDLVKRLDSLKAIQDNISSLPIETRFAGENETPERLGRSSGGNSDYTKRFHGRLRTIIKRHMEKLKLDATHVHFHHEDGDTATNVAFPLNKTVLRSIDNYTSFGRSKRDVIFADASLNYARRRRKILNHDTEGTFVISNVERSTPQYFEGTNAVDINCQQVQEKTLVFSIEDSTERNERKLMVHQLNDRDLKQRFLMSTTATDAVSVEVFQMKNDLFAFTTVEHNPETVGSQDTINTGSTLYRVNFSNKTLEKTQTIHMPFAKSSAFWSGMGEEANDKFLVIAPTKALTERGTTFNVMVPCYRWQGGYFDYVSRFPATNPQSINHFNMLSHDYLAVANYQDDTGSTTIQSEIFKYQHNEGRFVSFQKIKTYGAKDIKHFTFESVDGSRKEHFIAIANSCKKEEDGSLRFWVQSPIMKYGQVRFLPFRSFYAYGAQQFLPVKHEDKFFLALADLHGIRMFQYNGWSFVETFHVKYETEQKSPFSLNLRQLNRKDLSYITLASKTPGIQNGMFAVDFETRNDHRRLFNSVGTWCDEVKKFMENKNLVNLEREIDEAPKVSDKNLVVKGAVIFKNGVQVGDLQSRALRMGRARSLGHNELTTLSHFEKRFNLRQGQLNDMKSLLNGVVRVDRDQDIFGSIFISQMTYENPMLQIKDLKITEFGSLIVAEHLDNLVFLNKPQNLKKIVTDAVVFNDISTQSINGHPLDDYALRNPSAKQIFTGNNEYTSKVLVKDSISVKDNFAGLSFSKINFLLISGNQSFEDATMHLSQTKIKNLYTLTLNGHDVLFHFNDAVPLSGGIITANKEFSQVQIQKLTVNSINNENMNELFENAIYTKKSSSQSFTAPKYFESMEINELNPTDGKINEEFDLSSDFINVLSGEYTLNNLMITRETHIEDLFVQKELNGIKVTEGRLEILMKNSADPQHVKLKKLEALEFNNHVDAPGKVDGIDLQNWSQHQNIILSNNVVDGIVNVNGNMEALEMMVSGALTQGDSDVLHVLTKSARLDAAQLPGSCGLEMESLKVEGNSDIKGVINGDTNPSQWVINSEHLEVIVSGEKIFAGPVHFEKDVEAEALFGSKDKTENLLEVFPTLLLDGPNQNILQEMTFTENFRADMASCQNAMLDGIHFQNIIFKKGDYTVEIESVFRQPLVAKGGTLVTGDLFSHFVNEININDQLKDTLRTGEQSKTQFVSGDYSFTEVSTKEAIVQGNFAGHNAESLFGNIVNKRSHPVELSGSHLIFANANLDQLNFIGHLNGIPTSDWGRAWMITRTDQVVNTKVEFTGPLTVTKLDAPTVNNVDIKQLSQDIIRVDRDERLENPLIFRGSTLMKSGVDMPNAAVLNGMNLGQDILLKSSPNRQTISGSNSFMKGFTVQGHLWVNEIPNFDVENFVKLLQTSGLQSRSDTDPISLIINGKATLENEPEFKSSINEHNWQNIMDNLWFRDGDIVLQSPVQFSSLILENGGLMEDTSTLNGLNLKDFQKSYASKSRDNVWTQPVTFQQVDGLNKIESQSLVLENGGKFNGEDIEKFYDSVLKYSGDQIILGDVNAKTLKTKQLDTEEGATLNNVEIRDFMTISGENELRATKSFDNIIADKVVLAPGTFINGVNMGNWNENAVRREGDFEIQGVVEFPSLQTTENVIVNGLVDGIKYDVDNVLTSDQPQEILGSVTINEPSDRSGAALKVPGVVVETLNGVDVANSIKKLVFTTANDDTPIVINSDTVFNAPVTMDEVQTQALLQGQNVSEVMGNFKRAHEEVSSNFVAREGYETLLSMASKMLQVSENKAVFMEYYILTQTIQIRSIYVKVLNHVGFPAIAMGFKKSERVTTENWWAYNVMLDYYQLQIGNRVEMEGNVVDMVELEHENGNFIAFAVNNDDNERPAESSLDVRSTLTNFEINKSPDKLSKTFILKTVDAGTPNVRSAISQIIYGNSFNSIRSFKVTRKMGVSSCMIATTKTVDVTDSTAAIYCLDNTNGAMNKIQDIAFDSPSLTTAVVVSNKTLLGVLTRSNNAQPEGLLEIWSSSGMGDALQFAKQNCLPVFNAISLDTLSTNDGKTFLTIASGAISNSNYQGSVFIYRYSMLERKFKKIQTIEVSHPLDVKLQWLKPSNEVVVYVLSESVTNNVNVYKYKGLSGWNLVHQFTSTNGKNLQVADFTMNDLYRAQLLVTSPTETKIYAAEFKGITTVLEESTESQSVLNLEVVDFDL